MRNRYAPMLVAFVAGALVACRDAAVDTLTAPIPTATPATPVANQWPSISEYELYGIPSTLGIQIDLNPFFGYDYRTFVVSAHVRFQWSNEVTARLEAKLLNQDGQVVNWGSSGMAYTRWMLPVAQGDTTFEIRISTNDVTCGLLGKSVVEGRSAQVAVDFRLVTITLFSQTIPPTTGRDVSQPACPPPPDAPPPGCEEPTASRVIGGVTGVLASEGETCDAPSPPSGSQEEFEICVSVWRQLWIWDFYSNSLTLWAEWFIGVICYFITLAT